MDPQTIQHLSNIYRYINSLYENIERLETINTRNDRYLDTSLYSNNRTRNDRYLDTSLYSNNRTRNFNRNYNNNYRDYSSRPLNSTNTNINDISSILNENNEFIRRAREILHNNSELRATRNNRFRGQVPPQPPSPPPPPQPPSPPPPPPPPPPSELNVDNIRNRVNNVLRLLNNRTPYEFSILTSNSIDNDNDTNVISHTSISKNTTIEKLDLIQSTDDNDNDTMCVICRELMIQDSIVKKINRCNHIFHVNCIDTWFDDNITCPHCRQDIRDV
jgi:hypothetical protein